MKLAVGSDERTHVTDWIVEELRARGVEVDLHGALKPGADSRWPEVASSVAMDVAGGRCHGRGWWALRSGHPFLLDGYGSKHCRQ